MHQPPLRIECVDDQTAEVLRAKTPAEKVAMISAANRTARVLVSAGAKHLHPEWDESQIQAEVVKRVRGGTG